MTLTYKQMQVMVLRISKPLMLKLHQELEYIIQMFFI